VKEGVVSSSPAIWDRVVCGIDGTRASFEAARAVSRLMPPSASLTLCAVVDLASGRSDESTEQQLTSDAQAALRQAQQEIDGRHDAELLLREGAPSRMLLDAVATERATLVAVGSHGRGRAAGFAFGSVASTMLHQTSCSVLISHSAEREREPKPEGGVVVIGFDGSGGARRALAVARELSARLAMQLHAVVALGGALVAPELLWVQEDLGDDVTVSEDPRPPVSALAEASRSADLVIVGSRHLPGVLSALSSVSERTAHRVACPVLVVR